MATKSIWVTPVLVPASAAAVSVCRSVLDMMTHTCVLVARAAIVMATLASSVPRMF